MYIFDSDHIFFFSYMQSSQKGDILGMWSNADAFADLTHTLSAYGRQGAESSHVFRRRNKASCSLSQKLERALHKCLFARRCDICRALSPFLGGCAFSTDLQEYKRLLESSDIEE
jgi:hypothetical protein